MKTNALERNEERLRAAQLMREDLPASFSLSRRLFAWGVHLFTASGAVAGLLAVVAVAQREWRQAMFWIFLAFLMDGVDGTLARAAHVGEVLPDFSGKMLDYVVDFLTFVVAPAFFLYQADLLPEPARLACVAAILLVSGYHYGNLKAVTADYHFKGLPGPWNVIAFYLFVLELGGWWNVLIIAAACILHFVPIKFVYPTRTRRLRRLTLGLTFLVCFLNAVILLWYPVRNPLLIIASLLIIGYLLALSLYQTFAD